VASRLPAVTSYFRHDTFLYATPGEPDDLAGRIQYAFAHPEEMRERALAAREVLETFAWDRERRKYLHAVLGRAAKTPETAS
jgi:hypothetical protein